MSLQARMESVLAAPPAGAIGLTILGYPLSDVVLWLNFVYIAILLVYKLWQIYDKHINKNNQEDV